MYLINFGVEYINTDDVMAFFLYLMNKMQWILIKIRSCANLGWTNRLPDRFSSYLKVDERLPFCLVDKEQRKFVDSSYLKNKR